MFLNRSSCKRRKRPLRLLSNVTFTMHRRYDFLSQCTPDLAMHKWYHNNNNKLGLHQLCYLALHPAMSWLWMTDPLLSIVRCLCCLNIYVHILQVGKLRPGEVLDPKVRFVL